MMTAIQSNLIRVKNSLPPHVTLVAVSKTKPIEYLQEAYDVGQRIFGENKALELRDKHEFLPKDIEWHFIGHLQSNKIKYIAPFIGLIHGIDSLKLLVEINKAALKCDRVIPCLLQFHIAEEETKFGFSLEEVMEMLQTPEFASLQNVSIVGVMGMATYTDNQDQIRQEFHQLRQIFDELKSTYFEGNDSFAQISMGMTDDYPIAVDMGSTMVRVGSAIFGERVYP